MDIQQQLNALLELADELDAAGASPYIYGAQRANHQAQLIRFIVNGLRDGVVYEGELRRYLDLAGNHRPKTVHHELLCG
ncbi:hypothetical protein [Dongshaea marina]|uniref:hypothetical protein n=1 Tax=Dongshaea marina TaxID=2047966 RepID=UPI00131F0331|nr:hypothetical protein [Dongshaea marina]